MEEKLIAQAGLPFFGIPAGGLHGVGLLKALRNGWLLLKGTLAAWKKAGRERPDAMLTTGGYVSGAAAVAAWLRGTRILLYVPDIEPALSVKAVAQLARRIGMTVEDSRRYLPASKATVTGYPLREEFTRWDRASGRAALGLTPEGPAVLIFGGSRGARSINQAVLGALEPLLAQAQLIHISGEGEWAAVEAARAALPADLQSRYHAYPYLHEEMGAAMAAADLAICRAGASILGELPYFGLPALLVPYPYAWRYQKVNASWLTDRGAAMIVADGDLATQLLSTTLDLLTDESRRSAMAAAARSLAKPEAARRLAEMLTALGAER